jgi:uncharacterized protein
MRNFKAKVKEHFRHVLETKTSPHSLAFGFALGAFLAILPTPGFSIIFGILSLLIFKSASKYAMFAALAIFNPFVTAPLYVLSYRIGDVLFGQVPVGTITLNIFYTIYQFSRRFIIGNLMIATAISTASYGLIYAGVHLIKGWRRVNPRVICD